MSDLSPDSMSRPHRVVGQGHGYAVGKSFIARKGHGELELLDEQ